MLHFCQFLLINSKFKQVSVDFFFSMFWPKLAEKWIKFNRKTSMISLFLQGMLPKHHVPSETRPKIENTKGSLKQQKMFWQRCQLFVRVGFNGICWWHVARKKRDLFLHRLDVRIWHVETTLLHRVHLWGEKCRIMAAKPLLTMAMRRRNVWNHEALPQPLPMQLQPLEMVRSCTHIISFNRQVNASISRAFDGQIRRKTFQNFPNRNESIPSVWNGLFGGTKTVFYLDYYLPPPFS